MSGGGLAKRVNSNAYPFEIPVDHVLVVHVDEPLDDVLQLEQPHPSSALSENPEEMHTRSSRFTSGRLLTYSTMFPFLIHSDTITNLPPAMVTPINCDTFG